MGYERNIVVLTRPADYVKFSENNPLFRLRYTKYPNFRRALARRHIVYNETMGYIDRRAREGAAFVIRPRAALPIGRTDTDPERIEAVYRIGREDAERRMEALKDWIKNG